MDLTKLARMLYSLMVGRKAACHTFVERLLEVHEDVVKVLLVLQVLYLIAG